MTDLFRRDWPPPYVEPGTPGFPRPAPPSPPLVRCRDATAAETPDEARRAADNAHAAGWTVRVTYGQGGTWILGSRKGKCYCGTVVRLYKETGFMMAHRPPPPTQKIACAGGYRNFDGNCSACGQSVRLLKNGGLGKHYLKFRLDPCTHVEGPKEDLGVEKFEPDASTAVRIARLGWGLWVRHLGEWAFDIAYLCDRDVWRKVGATEFQAACKTTPPA